MKRISLLAVAAVILAALALCMGSTSPAPSQEPSQVEQLKKDVDSLRQRVESLEKQLKDHSIVIPKDVREMPIIRPPFQSRPMPKSWRPFEFNGMTYYMVPVDTPARP